MQAFPWQTRGSTVIRSRQFITKRIPQNPAYSTSLALRVWRFFFQNNERRLAPQEPAGHSFNKRHEKQRLLPKIQKCYAPKRRLRNGLAKMLAPLLPQHRPSACLRQPVLRASRRLGSATNTRAWRTLLRRGTRNAFLSATRGRRAADGQGGATSAVSGGWAFLLPGWRFRGRAGGIRWGSCRHPGRRWR